MRKEDLFRAIRDLALVADALEPLRVGQRAFDRARRIADFDELPHAGELAEGFGRPWPQVLWLAFIDRRAPGPGQPGTWPTPSYAEMSLRLVARSLGRSPRPHEFGAVRVSLVETHPEFSRDGFELLPTHRQLMRIYGNWAAALQAAGLQSLSPTGPRHRGMPVAAAFELHLELHGCLPSGPRLADFARIEQLPLAGTAGRSLKDLIAELREDRSRRGLWTPPHRPVPRQQPSYDEPAHLDEEGQRTKHRALQAFQTSTPGRRGHRFTKDDCRKAMQQFLSEIPPDRVPTRDAYEAFRRETPGLPWAASFRRHGGFAGIRDEVMGIDS